MSRLPITVRLALAFALAAAVVLVGIGVLLTMRRASTLDEVVDDGLAARAAELAPRVASGEDPVAGLLADPDEQATQVLDATGRIVAGSPGVAAPLLRGDIRSVSLGVARRFELDDASPFDGRARVLATRVVVPDGARVLIVAASLEDRDETVHGFVVELAFVGPIALALVSLLGYALARASLRPVGAMRREAEAISASEPDRRLPLPASRDELRRLGETLNEMLGRLQGALERERTLVADASHELRSPLARLTAELELALRRPRSEAELEAAIRAAAVEATRLARLADDLLLLARSDDGRLPVERRPLDVRELLERAAGRAAARPAGVDVDTGLVVQGDTVLLEQAIGNLVENAIRHGGGRVELEARERDGAVEIHVLDDGPGFPASFLPHAFDRFSRADEARTSHGTGLGLTIAAAIARAHGGAAGARNRERGGADVWLSLPSAVIDRGERRVASS